MGAKFTIYPAIDLRRGQVVRLAQGDPERQTTYADEPAGIARQWLQDGADWLHVVNLDGAFGEPGQANRQALQVILQEAARCAPGCRVQFGGGLRSLQDIEQALTMGVERVILGTVAAEQPEIARRAIQAFGARRFVLGMDVREGQVQVRGWSAGLPIDSVEMAREYTALGVRACVYTNVARDGLGLGVDIDSTRQFAAQSGLETIASGGVASLEEVRLARQAGLSGIIIGRALYEGAISLKEALSL
jgi:phosphoribosylformimino-5-aminoimidazole carboxamide ribotide isomerase